MTAVGAIRSIVLECRDPAPLAEFWSAVLGREVDDKDDAWWSLVRGPDGSRMAFQVVERYVPPPWPGRTGEQQVHLDVEVDDMAVAAAAVLELGARQLAEVIDHDGDVWQVFADPAGHPFCLVADDDT